MAGIVVFGRVLSLSCRYWARGIHSSQLASGLEEFFPKTSNIIEESEKTGRSWEARELRHKSNEDLHKLWYVLLKERNMLLTLRHEANRHRFIMPAPERLKKVKRSMAQIKVVIGERDRAVEKARELLSERRKEEKRLMKEREENEQDKLTSANTNG